MLATAVALALPCAAAAGVPEWQTFEPKGLGVSFQLPSDWGADLPADRGWSWQAIAPGYTAHFYLAASPAKATFAQLRSQFERVLRARALAADPRASVVASTVRVASAPAVEIVTRVHARTVNGPVLVVDYTYAFEHGGKLWIFDYNTTAKWLPKEKRAFDESISSVRFSNVA